jgi:hypothetical protein
LTLGEGERDKLSPPPPPSQRGIDLARFKDWITSGTPCSHAMRAVLTTGIVAEIFFVVVADNPPAKGKK